MRKPDLTFLQIWNMSFGFFGIQIAFALQNGNVSRIFQTLGADMASLPVLWLAGPVTGLLVQPVIGYFSDRTWTGLGRRRPYFLVGAILTSAALLVMPNSPLLWVAAATLWILDASINISMEPFRAFVGDLLPSRQRTQGYAMQGVFIGAGAVLASAAAPIFTNLGIPNVAPAGEIAPSVKLAFYVGAAAVFIAVGWTILTTKEYSPQEMASFDEENALAPPPDAALMNEQKSAGYFATVGVVFLLIGFFASWLVQKYEGEVQLYILTGGVAFVGLVFGIASIMRATDGKASNWVCILGLIIVAYAGIQVFLVKGMHTDLRQLLPAMGIGFLGILIFLMGLAKGMVVEVPNDLVTMPRVMRRLAVVQFFTWFALFIMWIYSTPAVTAYHYGTTDVTSQAYGNGADWIGWMFAVYNGVGAIYAFIIPAIAKKIGAKKLHAFNLLAGAAGFASYMLFKDPQFLLISMVGVGMAWASLLTVPYAILSDSLPTDKMGTYMGIFNFFIVIPQIIVAGIMGTLMNRFLDNEAILTFPIAAGVMAIAAFAMFFVPTAKEQTA